MANIISDGDDGDDMHQQTDTCILLNILSNMRYFLFVWYFFQYGIDHNDILWIKMTLHWSTVKMTKNILWIVLDSLI